jgi:hypothetical protein
MEQEEVSSRDNYHSLQRYREEVYRVVGGKRGLKITIDPDCKTLLTHGPLHRSSSHLIRVTILKDCDIVCSMSGRRIFQVGISTMV